MTSFSSSSSKAVPPQDSLFPSADLTPVPSTFPEKIYAGTSGWAYPAWKPAFYPAKLPAKRFLEHYASRLNSVEVNYTFRALPTPSMVANWLEATSPNFRFSFKAPQRITHFSRLENCAESVAYFVSSLEPIRAAGRLGPLLFQLPPTFKADALKLTAFLQAPALNGPNAPQVAFEFRHSSWFSEEIYTVLRTFNAAMCGAESDDLQTPDVLTAASFTCYRLRRTSGYSADDVAAFVERFVPMAKTRDVFIYFKHEDDPTGALNAEQFLQACAAKATS